MAYCEFCEIEFEPTNKQRFCSKSCGSKYICANRTDDWRADNRGEKNGMYGSSVHHPNSLANLRNDAMLGKHHSLESKNKCSLTMLSLNLHRSDETKMKQRITCEAKGLWRKPDDPFYKSYKKYRRKVYYWTNQQTINTLANADKRGQGIDNYHLDHKYSIFKGFKNDIAPKIIGHISNLEFIKSGKNTKKGTSCSITKEELLHGL